MQKGLTFIVVLNYISYTAGMRFLKCAHHGEGFLNNKRLHELLFALKVTSFFFTIFVMDKDTNLLTLGFVIHPKQQWCMSLSSHLRTNFCTWVALVCLRSVIWSAFSGGVITPKSSGAVFSSPKLGQRGSPWSTVDCYHLYRSPSTRCRHPDSLRQPLWLLSTLRYICLVASVTADLLWLYRAENTNVPYLRLTVEMLAWFNCYVCPVPGDRLLRSADGEVCISNSYLCFTPELVVILWEQKILKVIEQQKDITWPTHDLHNTTHAVSHTSRNIIISVSPSKLINTLLHEIFATLLFRDVEVRIFRDTLISQFCENFVF